MQAKREGMAATALGQEIYVAGGFDGTSLSSVEAYSPSARSWTSRGNMPATRVYMGYATHGKHLYLFGGLSSETYFTQTYSYNPASNAWRPRAPMPTSGYYMSAVCCGDRIYVIGGYTNDQRSLYIYDPTIDQ